MKTTVKEKMTQKDLEQFMEDTENLENPVPDDVPYRLEVLQTRIQDHLNNETSPSEEEVKDLVSDYEYVAYYLAKNEDDIMDVVSWLRSFTEGYD